jgi:glutathione S-transferase
VLELYHSPSSTCSQKVRLCLAEKRLDWVDRRVNTLADEHLRPEYLKLNPNGVVPTLVHDGRVILDSSVICEYLDEVYPAVRLTPSDLVIRAHMRAWMRFLEEVPTPAIRVPSFHLALARRFGTLDATRFRDEVADRRPLRKHMYRRMGPQGFSREALAESLEQLGLALARMEEALGRAPWLAGAELSLADFVALPFVDRMDDIGLSGMWAQRPLVAGWYRRLAQRPSYVATYYSGARLSARLEIDAVDPALIRAC